MIELIVWLSNEGSHITGSTPKKTEKIDQQTVEKLFEINSAHSEYSGSIWATDFNVFTDWKELDCVKI